MLLDKPLTCTGDPLSTQIEIDLFVNNFTALELDRYSKRIRTLSIRNKCVLKYLSMFGIYSGILSMPCIIQSIKVTVYTKQ